VALDWPMPRVLRPNEIIQVNWEQVSPATANTIFAIGFTAWRLSKVRCDPGIPEGIKDQIERIQFKHARYIHLKPTTVAAQFSCVRLALTSGAVANTIEVAEHTLLLGLAALAGRHGNGSRAAPSTTIAWW